MLCLVLSRFPPGTFITHNCPLYPLISTCISVPFGSHWAVDYCYNVHWCVWVPVLCVLAFMPLWIAQMITGRIQCVNHCVRVSFIRGTPLSFVWVSTLCFYSVFVWSSSPCLYMVRHNLGLNKKPYYAFLSLSPESFMPTWQVWYVLICECPSSILYDMLQMTICIICYELKLIWQTQNGFLK